MQPPSEPPFRHLRACPICGLVQRVPALGPADRARCERFSALVLCGRRLRRGNSGALSAAVAAHFLYPLAVSLPIMRLERFGHATEASVLSGSVWLLREGELFVGGLVLLCSVVLPLLKLGLLVFLCTSQRFSSRHRAGFYRGLARKIHEHAHQTSQPTVFDGLSAPGGALRNLASSTTRSGSPASAEPAKHHQEPSCCVWCTSS